MCAPAGEGEGFPGRHPALFFSRLVRKGHRKGQQRNKRGGLSLVRVEDGKTGSPGEQCGYGWEEKKGIVVGEEWRLNGDRGVWGGFIV